MAGPVLIVELPTADTTRAEAAALVQSCTEGLGVGRCALSSSPEAADGVATVSLRGKDGLGALIEVGSRRIESRPWRSQELTFHPEDARIERFRTLGLAIATLYNEAQLEAPSANSPAQTNAQPAPSAGNPKPASSAPKVGKASATRTNDEATPSGAAPSRQGSPGHPRGWLSAGAVTAYDHELPSAFRFGGQLALGIAPIDLPMFAILSGSYAVGRFSRAELAFPVSLSWATLGLGPGAYLRLVENVVLRVSVQGALVELEAHASDPERGQQESERWLLGGQAVFELAGWASRRWGFALGCQLQQLTGATTIVVGGRPVAQVAAFSVQFGAALEFRPFQR